MARVRNNKSKYISKGQRRSSMRTADNNPIQRILNQHKAHSANKRVMLTIENPNKQETNKRFIRVPASTVWRDPKNQYFIF